MILFIDIYCSCLYIITVDICKLQILLVLASYSLIIAPDLSSLALNTNTRLRNDACISGDEKKTHIVERLFNSSLVAVVNRDEPHSLKICHFKKGSEICKYGYPSNILSVKLNRQVREVMVDRLILISFVMQNLIILVLPTSYGL